MSNETKHDIAQSNNKICKEDWNGKAHILTLDIVEGFERTLEVWGHRETHS